MAAAETMSKPTAKTNTPRKSKKSSKNSSAPSSSILVPCNGTILNSKNGNFQILRVDSPTQNLGQTTCTSAPTLSSTAATNSAFLPQNFSQISHSVTINTFLPQSIGKYSEANSHLKLIGTALSSSKIKFHENNLKLTMSTGLLEVTINFTPKLCKIDEDKRNMLISNLMKQNDQRIRQEHENGYGTKQEDKLFEKFKKMDENEVSSRVTEKLIESRDLLNENLMKLWEKEGKPGDKKGTDKKKEKADKRLSSKAKKDSSQKNLVKDTTNKRSGRKRKAKNKSQMSEIINLDSDEEMVEVKTKVTKKYNTRKKKAEC